MRLSGLEPLTITPETNFVVIGERTNVTGSAAFRRLIKDDKYDEAVAVARQQVEGGANILDVCMDEGMLDGVAAMRRFLNLIAAEPDIARIPVMVDSSKFSRHRGRPRVPAGQGRRQLDLAQGGRGRVHPPGDDRPRSSARPSSSWRSTRPARRPTVEHRVSIAQRAYKILTEQVGFPPEDIIFDPNILTIGTGIEEHDPYAVDFIEAVRRIKAELPGAKVSGGVSNLSFSFRTTPRVREAMHAVFLYHAIQAGLDMAIVNAGQLAVYEQLDPGAARARRGSRARTAAPTRPSACSRSPRRSAARRPKKEDELAVARRAARQAARARAGQRHHRLHRSPMSPRR